MLWLWCRRWLVLLIFSWSSGLWLWCLLCLCWCSLLLWLGCRCWGLVLDGSLDEGWCLGDGGEDGLCGDGLVPSDGVWVLRSPLLVEESLEAAGEESRGEEVSEGEALADEVGVD